MTVLERLISFARALPDDRREAVEATLAALMKRYSADFDLTQAELSEIDARLADPTPKYASTAEITRLFGKPFAE